jgi:hypothetical protein
LECFSQFESNKLLLNTKENKVYKLNLLLSLIKIYTRAEDFENFNKYFKRHFEVLNKLCNKEQIFYINRVMKLIYEIVLISTYSKNGGTYENAIYDYMKYVENFYIKFHNLDQSKLTENIEKLNYVFGNFYFTAALIMKEINVDDSVVAMNLANQIYFYKLGNLSYNFKDSRNFLLEYESKCTLDY